MRAHPQANELRELHTDQPSRDPSALRDRLSAWLGEHLQGFPGRRLVSWVLYGLALLVAMACSSFDPTAPSESGGNLGGAPGQWLARILLESVGIGAFLLSFFLVLLGWSLQRGRSFGRPVVRVFGLFAAMAFLGITLELLPVISGRQLPGAQVPVGGTLGVLTAEKLQRRLPSTLAALLCGLGLASGVLLALGRGLMAKEEDEETLHGEEHQEPIHFGATATLEAEPMPEVQETSARSRRRRRPRVLETDEERAEESVEAESEDAGEEEAHLPPPVHDWEAEAREALEAGLDEEEEVEEVDEELEDESEAFEEEDDESEADFDEDAEEEEDDSWGAGIEGEWDDERAALEAEVEEDEDAQEAEVEEEEELPEELPAPRARRKRARKRAAPVEEEAQEAEEEADEAPSAEAESEAEEASSDPEPEEDAANEPEEKEAEAAPQAGARAPVLPGREGVTIIQLDREKGVKRRDRYSLPGLELLADPPPTRHRESDSALQAKAAGLEAGLSDFGINAQVTSIERGPVITRFDLTLSRGTKISKVTNLADDLALNLGVSRVRIAPVGNALGVELPNKVRESVVLRQIADTFDTKRARQAIPLFLGKDASGHPIIEDLATTPHLLIAGRTGAGKSVFINSLVLSILLTRHPEDVRLIMIDPKKVELEVYQDIPHLLTKVESSPKRATKILEWAVDQMEERYNYLAATGVRHLKSYNAMKKGERIDRLGRKYTPDEVAKIPDHLPYIVIIVDELADLMMVSGKEVEQAIARLSQKARAVGIHVVLATQRPSIDVITGLIKSNLPARIAFQTRTGIDSRTILDRQGAEKLLDKGDMLYLSATSDIPRRVQGPFVSDEEVERVVHQLRVASENFYRTHLVQATGGEGDVKSIASQDELFEAAVDTVFSSGQASSSFLQRRMHVGYSRAGRLIDLMAMAGIVSESKGSKAREILITPEQWEEIRSGQLKKEG